jgi:multidrug resistance efflux pump
MKTSRWPSGRLMIAGCAAAAICAVPLFLLARHAANGETTGMAGEGQYLTTLGPKEGRGQKADAGASARHLDDRLQPALHGKIRTQTVEAVTRHATLRMTASLEADEKSDVGSNAQGNVWQTCVDRGSFVKKGDLLVQLDSRDAQYALDEGVEAVEQLRVRLGLDEAKEFRVDAVPEVEAAKLALDLAQRTLRRCERLEKENAIALEAFDQAETDYRSAVQRHLLAVLQAKQLYRSYRAAMTHVVTLQKGVEDCSLRAPFDGWVAERDISVGERVIAMFPGAKLVTVLRIDPLRLVLPVPQQAMAYVHLGQGVTFQADAFPGKTFRGTVRYVTPAVTAEGRSLVVEAVVPNPHAVLRPGTFVTAELELDAQQTDLFRRISSCRARRSATGATWPRSSSCATESCGNGSFPWAPCSRTALWSWRGSRRARA